MSNNVTSPRFYGGRDEGLRGTTEIEKLFSAAYDSKHCVLTYTGDDLTQVDVWDDNTLTIKLFTRTLSYTGENLTTVTTIDERTGRTLTTTFAYTGDDLASVTKVIA